MKFFPGILALFLAALLPACIPAPREAPRPGTVDPPKAAPPGDITPGFNEREPDTCKAASLQGLIGQPSGNLRTVVLPGPVRIVGPGQVVDQEEYRSARVNAHVDGKGVIQRLSCG